MNISTKFDLGDTVYPNSKAIDGILLPSIVEKIKIEVETNEITVISYQISNNQLFQNEYYYESDLKTYNEAKEIAETELESEKEAIQTRIDNL